MADGGVLTDRASLVRAFYRLTATSATNPALIEHDGSATLEAVYQFLQYGLWDAQAFLMDAGLSSHWITTSAALSSWSGSDSTTGGRYQALPADFMRLAGDLHTSALHYPDGTRWGTYCDYLDGRTARGDYYWLRAAGTSSPDVWNLWIAPSASPQSTLVADYHHRHATLADGTTIDFPTEFRALPVAFAADRAMTDAWLPGDMEMQAKISSNLAKLKKEAQRRVRLSRGPKKIRTNRTGATHWWA